MKLLKVGMFSLGLVGGAAATFAGKDCCCCGADCNKAECHNGCCLCCCSKEYDKCGKKCDEGWFKKQYKRDKSEKGHFDQKDKSVVKTIDLKD